MEKIKVEVAGSYGLDGKIDKEQLNKNLKRINGLTYKDSEIDLNDDTKKITTFPATVKLDGYLYEIEENGKVSNKKGITLSSSNLSMAPGDTKTLTVTFVGMQEENITWTSDKQSVATVENGVVTAVANGTAKITATCGTKSAVCDVAVVSKLAKAVEVGSYVDINIGYVDQMNSTDYTTATNIKKAWRVLWKDETNGLVNLISTGHPLKFFHPGYGSEDSVVELNKMSTQPITVNASTTRGYRGNGFSTNDIKSLFNNISVFSEIQPTRYSVAGVSITWSTPANIRVTGQYYLLGEKADTYPMWSVRNDGSVAGEKNRDFGVRPVVSLVSGVTIKDGEGTETSPYRLNGITYPQN